MSFRNVLEVQTFAWLAAVGQVLVTLSSCGDFGRVSDSSFHCMMEGGKEYCRPEPKRIPGTPGETGAPGINGKDGTPGTAGLPGITGPQGAAGANGANGQNGTNGKDGKDGAPGAAGSPGTVVLPIKLCNESPTYGTFPEFAFCINNKLYGVYSANGGFMAELPPGGYSSQGINSACSFTVGANCAVTVSP